MRILPLCVALLVLAATIVFHANTGRYQFSYVAGHLTYAKLDTRTGAAWLCGAALDECIPMTNKAAFLAYQIPASRSDKLPTAEELLGPKPTPAEPK
jgi:hypothetical protein